MVDIYEYNRALYILKMLRANEIVSLNVYKDESLKHYVFDYKTSEDYPEENHLQIRSAFNVNNLPIVLNAAATLEIFITNKRNDKVTFFEMEFNLLTGKLTTNHSFNDGAIQLEEPSSSNILSDIEKLLSDKELLKAKVPGLYEQSLNSKQQQRSRYVQTTFETLLSKLKEVISDGTNQEE